MSPGDFGEINLTPLLFFGRQSVPLVGNHDVRSDAAVLKLKNGRNFYLEYL